MFSKNRDRLLGGEIAAKFLAAALAQPKVKRLLSTEHFSADLWDRGYLDLAHPPRLVIGVDGHGEIAFGALEAGLDLSYAKDSVWFEWDGADEGDQVSGQGCAHLEDDGSLEIDFEWRHGGDEAVLQAVRA